MFKGKNNLERIKVAIEGIVAAYKSEKSFRFIATTFLLLLMLIIVLRVPLVWIALFLLVSGIIFTVELINTSIEALLDFIHPEYHLKIRFIKDCLAGAVLIMSITAIIIFLLFLISKFIP